jgi:hypothetical protein
MGKKALAFGGRRLTGGAPLLSACRRKTYPARRSSRGTHFRSRHVLPCRSSLSPAQLPGSPSAASLPARSWLPAPSAVCSSSPGRGAATPSARQPPTRSGHGAAVRWRPELAPRPLLERKLDRRLLDRGRHSVFQHRFAPRDLLEGGFAAFVI